MPEVIADTSPIQYLYQIGLLDVLNVLYGQITIPEAVAGELNVGRAHGLSLPDVSSISWMTVKTPQGQALLPLVPDLGPGEREAIALAIETKDSLLILDDALARKHAQLLGITMTGTLGVLLKAKQTGHLKGVESGPLGAGGEGEQGGVSAREFRQRQKPLHGDSPFDPGREPACALDSRTGVDHRQAQCLGGGEEILARSVSHGRRAGYGIGAAGRLRQTPQRH